MKITDVKISKLPDREPLKAFVSITFDECFVVHDLRIIKTGDKFFVAMPSKKIKDTRRLGNAKDTHKDIAHPIKPEMRSLIEEAVFEKYERMAQTPSRPGESA